MTSGKRCSATDSSEVPSAPWSSSANSTGRPGNGRTSSCAPRRGRARCRCRPGRAAASGDRAPRRSRCPAAPRARRRRRARAGRRASFSAACRSTGATAGGGSVARRQRHVPQRIVGAVEDQRLERTFGAGARSRGGEEVAPAARDLGGGLRDVGLRARLALDARRDVVALLLGERERRLADLDVLRRRRASSRPVRRRRSSRRRCGAATRSDRSRSRATTRIARRAGSIGGSAAAAAESRRRAR